MTVYAHLDGTLSLGYRPQCGGWDVAPLRTRQSDHWSSAHPEADSYNTTHEWRGRLG